MTNHFKTTQIKSVPLATPIAWKNPTDDKVYQATVRKVRGGSGLFDMLYIGVNGHSGVEMRGTDKVTWAEANSVKIDGPVRNCKRHGARVLFAKSTSCKPCQADWDKEVRQEQKEAKIKGETFVRRGLRRQVDPLTGDLTAEAQDRIASMIAQAKAAEQRTREQMIATQLRSIANGQGPRRASKAKALAYNSARFTAKCAEFGITVAQGVDLAGADAEHMTDLSWADYRKAFPKQQHADEAAA
jgi:hypothetical protein